MAAAFPQLSERASKAQGTCLNVTSRGMLCKALDPDDKKDWRVLAEQMGYDYQAIRNIERQRSPTEFLLNDWEKKSESTLEQLIHFLTDMERYDLLENEAFVASLESDAERHFKCQEDILQVPKVDSTVPDPPISMDCSNMPLTLGGASETFHAFISYAEEDFWFVNKMRKRLEPKESEGGYGLKFCIDVRDLLAGVQYEDIATVIRRKCRRILLIISNNFVKSEACHFHTKYAHALSPGYQAKKIIPIILEPTENVQEILRPLLPLNFKSKLMGEFFWERLAGSLQVPIEEDLNDVSYTQPSTDQSASADNPCTTVEVIPHKCVHSLTHDSIEKSRSCPSLTSSQDSTQPARTGSSSLLESMETSSSSAAAACPTHPLCTLSLGDSDASHSSTDSLPSPRKGKKMRSFLNIIKKSKK